MRTLIFCIGRSAAFYHNGLPAASLRIAKKLRQVLKKYMLNPKRPVSLRFLRHNSLHISCQAVLWHDAFVVEMADDGVEHYVYAINNSCDRRWICHSLLSPCG